MRVCVFLCVCLQKLRRRLIQPRFPASSHKLLVRISREKRIREVFALFIVSFLIENHARRHVPFFSYLPSYVYYTDASGMPTPVRPPLDRRSGTSAARSPRSLPNAVDENRCSFPFPRRFSVSRVVVAANNGRVRPKSKSIPRHQTPTSKTRKIWYGHNAGGGGETRHKRRFRRYSCTRPLPTPPRVGLDGIPRVVSINPPRPARGWSGGGGL